jgi:RNA polymerase sigma factor (sigma-70 family)
VSEIRRGRWKVVCGRFLALTGEPGVPYPLRPAGPETLGWEKRLPYTRGSLEQRVLESDEEAIGQVIRWIAMVLSSPRFWRLQHEWTDLHQDVLTRIIESLRTERYDASRDFHFYVLGITRFTALQALARVQMQDRGRGLLEESAEPAAAERRLIERDLVRRVLDRASEECRELIRSYFFEGREYSELAGDLSVPVGTVKSRLFRCLESAHLVLFGRISERSGKPEA